MTAPTLPADYARFKRVHSLDELVSTRFADGVNALCWARTLPGDFGEVVALLGTGAGITTIDEDQLRDLPASAAGRTAIDILLEDQRALRDHGLAPNLDCIRGYRRDESPGPVATDVFSFHVDSATAEVDTYLCTYHGAPSEGLRQDEAVRRVDVPATRAALLELYGGEDDAGFLEYLADHCYDLHYVSVGQAQSFSFGRGHLWRIATAWPGCPVPPCIHRAPTTLPDDPPRLLLIS